MDPDVSHNYPIWNASPGAAHRDSRAQMLDRAVEIDGVPVNDRGRHEGQARSPKALVLESPVAKFTLPMEKESAAQRVVLSQNYCVDENGLGR